MRRDSRAPRRAVVLAALALAGCALQPTEDEAYKQVRARMEQAQADQGIREHAAVLLKDSERTLQEAANADSRAQLRHLVYLTHKKLDIARAVSDRRIAEERLKALSAEGRRRVETSRLAGEVRQEQQSAARAREAAPADDPVAAVLSSFDTQQTARGIVLTLPDVLFDPGRSELSAGSVRSMDTLVAFLRANPRRRLVIEGHTDNTGSHEANLALSLARANSVKQFLVNEGIEAERIATLGHGDSYPAVSNSSPAGRQRNRRVEILIERLQ